MADALVCPTCSAPLEYPRDGGASLQCPYCKTTVLLNHQTRSTVGSVGGEIPEQFRPLVERALQMAAASGHVGSLNKIQAIKFYRQATGLGLAEAKRAVESVGPMSVGSGGNQLGNQAIKMAATGAKMGVGLAIVIIVFTAGLMIFIMMMVRSAQQQAISQFPQFKPPVINIPTVTLPPGLGGTPTPAAQFADQVMAFGSQGIGPGQFEDARSVAVDGAGHIYVAEYSNGRVQSFDSTGKYLSEFSIGKDKSILSLSADRNGVVYVAIPGHILRYNGTSGMQLEELDNSAAEDAPKFYMAACVAPGGDVYAVAGNSEIVHVSGSTGKIVSSFKASEKVGEDVDLSALLVMSTGEIFALDRQRGVFKFSADGRYINRFGGGKNKGLGAGHLGGPQSMAADGQGRLYISDGRIAVYDGDGNYVDNFGGSDVVFGLAVDDQDAVYACYRNRNQIRKFVARKH